MLICLPMLLSYMQFEERLCHGVGSQAKDAVELEWFGGVEALLMNVCLRSMMSTRACTSELRDCAEGMVIPRSVERSI